MKNSKIIILILLAIAMFSCSTGRPRTLINCEYQGAIILDKIDIGKIVYHIKYNDNVVQYVSVYDIDSCYNVGDTVNNPCRNTIINN